MPYGVSKIEKKILFRDNQLIIRVRFRVSPRDPDVRTVDLKARITLITDKKIFINIILIH
jgi:hypothetical protein